jgi:tRNA(Ile)-lysidine synthetase-like protein
LLLELTVRWARRHGAPVTAAHLHHGIRGAEADRDQAFCRQVAASLGIPYITRQVDVPARAARTGRSVEWEARAARYEFLSEVMQEEHIPLLLTAHHADDQLETLLLRLLRGSGTRGLGGIPPVRRMAGGLLIRPLLACTRSDILEACRRMGLAYVTDSTNLTDDCTRNRLRHRVVPLLEELSGPGVPQRAAVRLCRAAREDEDCLWQEAKALSSTVCGEDGSLSQAALSALPPAYAKRCLLAAYEKKVQAAMACPPDPAESYHAGDDAGAGQSERPAPLPADRTLTAAHLEALLSLVSPGESTGGVAGDRSGQVASAVARPVASGNRHPKAEVLLPGGWRGRLWQGRLVFLPPDTAAGCQSGSAMPSGSAVSGGSAGELTAPLRLVQGENRWLSGEDADTVILLEESAVLLSPRTGEGVLASAVFPADLPQPLWARRRRPGDTLLSHGMTKKLKKVLCDQHMPLPLRDRLPLICLPAGIPAGIPPEGADSASPPTGGGNGLWPGPRPGQGPGQPLWFPGAIFRDGWMPPAAGPCLRLTVLSVAPDSLPPG